MVHLCWTVEPVTSAMPLLYRTSLNTSWCTLNAFSEKGGGWRYRESWSCTYKFGGYCKSPSLWSKNQDRRFWNIYPWEFWGNEEWCRRRTCGARWRLLALPSVPQSPFFSLPMGISQQSRNLEVKSPDAKPPFFPKINSVFWEDDGLRRTRKPVDACLLQTLVGTRRICSCLVRFYNGYFPTILQDLVSRKQNKKYLGI